MTGRPSSCLAKVNEIVTVEIITVFFAFSLPLTQFGTQQLVYSKLCEQTFSSNHTTVQRCIQKSTASQLAEFQQVEADTSQWSIYMNIALIVPSLFTTVFMGAYVDKYGFYLPLRLCLAGALAGFIFLSVIASTNLSHAYILVAMAVISLFGHGATIFTTTVAYVACDSETDSTRKSIRVGIVIACVVLAVSVSVTLLGLIIDHLGIQWVFYLGSTSLFLGLLDSIFRLRPPNRHKPTGNHPPSSETHTGFAKIREVCSFSLVSNYGLVLFSKRQDSKRLHLHLMTAVFVLSFCAFTGVLDVEFLYLTKENGFTNTHYGIFMGTSGFLTFIGSTAGMYLTRKKLRLPLPVIVLIGSISSVVTYAGWSLAKSHELFWFFNTFKLFAALTPVGARSYISDCVELTEQGSIMSFVSVIESVFKLIASFVFNGIYPLTLSSWPGLVLMIAAGLCVIDLPVLVYLWYNDSKIAKQIANDVCSESNSSLLLTQNYDSDDNILSPTS